MNLEQLVAKYGGVPVDEAPASSPLDALLAKYGAEPVANPAPAGPNYSMLTANPHGEGVYQMMSPDGQTLNIPYGNVPALMPLRGWKFASPAVQATYARDYAADPSRATFWNALTNPIGSGGENQGPISAVQQVGGEAIKALKQQVTSLPEMIPNLWNTVMHPVDTAEGLKNWFQEKEAQGGLPLALEDTAGQLAGMVVGADAPSVPFSGMDMSDFPAVEKVAPDVLKEGLGGPLTRLVTGGKSAEELYQKALRLPITMSTEEREALTQTGLREKILPRQSGLDKLDQTVADLQGKVRAAIDTDPNATVDPNEVARYGEGTRAKFAHQVDPARDLKAIDKVRQGFLDQFRPPEVKPSGLLDAWGEPIQPEPGEDRPLTMKEAQAMKEGTYRALRGEYGELSSAAIEAQKALASGLRAKIAEHFPELNELNQREGQLLDLRPYIQRAVNRQINAAPLSMADTVTAGAAKVATHSNPAMWAATIGRKVISDPLLQARLAIAMSHATNLPYLAARAATGVRMAALASSLQNVSRRGKQPPVASTPTASLPIPRGAK